MDAIHDKKPRETNGRDTTLRFQMQFQAAAYAALEILNGTEVDRVYCDYHDDFVVRRTRGNTIEYHFFQVKTKGRGNQQWKVDEIYSIKKRGLIDSEEKVKEIRNSIAGKLFLHTIEFGALCREVTVLSNVHFKDEVYEVVNDLKAGASKKRHVKDLIDKFCEIFSPNNPLDGKAVAELASKFSLMPNVSYIGDSLEAFADAARNAIWKHSEIDLQRHEVDEIANNLVQMVATKSCQPIQGLSKENIDYVTGIGLDDLLRILSISPDVYRTLLAGEDPAAIKTASILQRQLKLAGASERMIETASRAKIQWDEWLRNARHTFPDFDLNVLLDEIDKNCQRWLLSGGRLADLGALIDGLQASFIGRKFSSLDADLLFGAFCSAVVRRAS